MKSNKCVVKVDNGIVTQLKDVGINCDLSSSYHVIPDYRLDVLGTVFDEPNKRFLDVSDNAKVVYQYA